MGKIFIYKDYDLVEELERAIESKNFSSRKNECKNLIKEIKKIIDTLNKSVKVMVEGDC